MLGREKKTLKHCEELRIKKELETSQWNFLHMKQRISEAYCNTTSMASIADSTPTVETASPTCTGPAIDASVREAGVSRKPGLSRKEVPPENMCQSAGVSSPPRREVARKPAIALPVGTTRAVFMSRRPEPPPKPRSERLATRGGIPMHKARVMVQSLLSPGRGMASVRQRRETVFRNSRAASSDSSEESEICGASCSDQSDGTVRRRKRRRPEKEWVPPRASIDQPDLSANCHVKSATQLLEEARAIAGVVQAGPSEGAGVQVRAPEDLLATAEVLLTEGGRTVDEIIAYLQSQANNEALSTCDKIIEDLMKSVLRDIYSTDNEEEATLESKRDPTIKDSNQCSGMASPHVSPSQRDVPGQQVPVRGQNASLPMSAPQTPVQTDALQGADPTPALAPAVCPAKVTVVESLPHEVTYADILVVRGSSLASVPRQRGALESRSAVQGGSSLLATWTSKDNSADEYKTIHHICTAPISHVLPFELQLASRACHTLSQLPVTAQFYQQGAALRHISDEAQRLRILEEGLPHTDICWTSAADSVTHLSPPTWDCLSDWQKIAEHYVERPRMVLRGQSTSLYNRELKMFWNPAPPKFTCAPSFIKLKLFPKYQGIWKDLASEELHGNLQDLSDVEDVGQNPTVKRVLSRHSKSTLDLREEEARPVANGSAPAGPERPQSAPPLSSGGLAALKVPGDRWAIPQELEEALSRAARPDPPDPRGPADPGEVLPATQSRSHLPRRKQKGRAAPGEKTQPRRRGGKGRKKLSPRKMAYVQGKLKEPPRTLSRSESLSLVPGRPAASPPWPELALPHPSPSLPLLLDFQLFTAEHGGVPEDVAPQEWVRDIWRAWFEELFPPLEGCDGRGKEAEALDEVQAPDRADLSQARGAQLESEVTKLSQAMAQQNRPSAFHLCRRGALHKKLGRLDLALEDLNTAISMEPRLLDAYWHRHSIHLLRKNTAGALDDLNFIIKHNSKHAGAFKAKAEIYRAKGETTAAITDYTKAIECRPQDDQNYFRRAEMFATRGEVLLAMDDYAKTFALNPGRTDALMTHGLQHFHDSNWMLALADFNLLLQQVPGNAKARTYRGRICTKLGQFQEAMEDFSLAVHLDPNNWVAFYHRGCLLRKRLPEMALRDLSTSVLINDSPENLSAFLHRGLLYTELKQWGQAMADFQAVIKLDRSVAVAHVNLGLIHMLKMDQNHEAIQVFTNGLREDPTYLHGYTCRAQAHCNVSDFRSAVKDLTHAIHMKPDAQYLYIMRGQCLCDMKQFGLATFCIQYAAEMNKVLGSSPIQQAAMQSFLGNNAKAITCLVAAAGAQPSPPVLILLGKTQMKAHKYTEAVESFRQALALLSPDQTDLCNIPEAAEVFYLTGLCYKAQVNLLQALDAFGCAVKLNPDYADAYHQRGLCRMHLLQSKCVLDFNRALAINPNLFQVYLSRAAFYGAKGRNSKAILNCNEAIRLQPRSVRAYLYRGALKFHMRKYEGAVEDLTAAIGIDSTCSFAHYNRGVCLQQLKQYELALRDYGIVFLLANRIEIDLKVLINRALLYVELDDYQNALQDFKAASKMNPDDATIYQALGVCHHRLGQLELSAEAYSLAVRLNPFFLEAYVGRGNVLMDYGHGQATKQAQRDFLSALRLDPLCSAARINLGYNFQVLGSFQRAWNQFTVAIDLDPRCWAALEGRAVVNLQMGNTFGAFYDINAAVKINPLSDQLHTNRGVVNQFMGDNVSAMKDYKKAVSLNPKYALAFFNAANLYFYNRQFEQACEFYSRALELDPEDESALLNRAITWTLLRKVPQAVEDFSRAQGLNPFSSHVFFNRATLYCSLRKYRSAERDLTQALHLKPGDALVHKLRADVRGHLGLTELALADYRMAVQIQEAALRSCCTWEAG